MGAQSRLRARWPPVNQAVRRSPGDLEALLAAGAQLRQAQGHLLKGGDAGEVREASEEERRSVDRVLAHAAAALVDSGDSGSVVTLARVRETLHAASTDEALREGLEAGVLVKEQRASGFGAAPVAPRPPATPRTAPPSASTNSRRRQGSCPATGMRG